MYDYDWNLKISSKGFSELDSVSAFGNLTISLIVVSYSKYTKVKNLSLLEQRCVYLILCFNSLTTKYAVYTGYTDLGFKRRFNTHKSQNKFKEYVIEKFFVFTSTKLFNSVDNLKYFENKFIQLVNDSNLVNINKQLGEPNVYDFNKPEHDGHFTKMKFLLQFLELGFLPKSSESETDKSTPIKIHIKDVLPKSLESKSRLLPNGCKREILFVCKGKRKNGGFFEGSGYLCGGEKFLVLKKSYTDISNFTVHSDWLKTGKRILKRLLDTEIIVQKNNFYVFQKDHLFSSPSGAAKFLHVYSINGWTAWKCSQTNANLNQVCQKIN